MKKDIRKLNSSKNIYVFAGKTTNMYKVPPDEYKRLLKENNQNISKIDPTIRKSIKFGSKTNC